jgi:hypothetical protein
MGQTNLAGRSIKIALAASLLVALAAWIVSGLPTGVLVTWFVAILGGIAAVSWHHRRRSLRPLERWALDPAPFGNAPAAAWAALTIVALAALVPVAIRMPLGLAVVGLTALYASRMWAWKVLVDRQA